MRKTRIQLSLFEVFGGLIVALLLAFSLACASAQPTATPAAVPTAQPTQLAAPTAIPQPTATASVPPTAVTKTENQPVYGGTLRYATSLGIDTLDPVYSSVAGVRQPNYTIHNWLLRMDPSLQLVPSLAASWDFSSDGASVTLHLQRNVKFHDGTEFNAEAVKWNFDRIMDPKQSSPVRVRVAPYVKQIEVKDQYTVTYQLNKPYRPLLPQLADGYEGIQVSPSAVNKYGGGRDGSFGRNPVGTGPFRFVEWAPGQYVKVQRNDDYWEKGKPYLDAITFLAVPEPSVRIAMLRTGEAEMVYNKDVVGKDVPLIENNPKLRMVRLPGVQTYSWFFNVGKPPFDNKELRQAFSYSIDRGGFIKSVLDGFATPAYTMISAGWAHNPTIKPIDYDIAKAKQKLAQAGFPQGVTIPMGCPSGNATYLAFCETGQAMAKQAGINVEIKMMEWTTYFVTTKEGCTQTVGLCPTRGGASVDPHITITQAYGFSRQNSGAYNNPEFYNLINEAAAVYDTAKAKALYDKLQTIWGEDVLEFPVASTLGLFAMSKRTQNFVPDIVGYEQLQFVWLEK